MCYFILKAFRSENVWLSGDSKQYNELQPEETSALRKPLQGEPHLLMNATQKFICGLFEMLYYLTQKIFHDSSIDLQQSDRIHLFSIYAQKHWEYEPPF